MDQQSQDELIDTALLIGAGLAAYFLLVKPILNAVGADPAAQATLDAQNSTVPSDSPLSYQFSESLYTQDPNTYGPAFWTGLKNEAQPSNSMFPATQGDPSLKYATWGEAVWSASSDWGSPTSDMNAVFDSIATQADASNIACYLFFNYNQDLFNLLLNGQGTIIPFIKTGMGATDLASLINHVNSLPVS